MAIRIDDLPLDELERRFAESVKHLEALTTLWPDLVRLPEQDRANHPGMIARILAAPFGQLFKILAAPSGPPAKGEPKLDEEATQQRARLARLQAVFHTTLGDQDEGLDPQLFEAELLLRRQRRHDLESQLSEKLADVSRHFADDVLHTGAAVAGPGQLALDLTRSIAAANSDFRTLLAPVLDALRDMTRAARAALARGKKAQAEQSAAKPADKPIK